MRALQELPESDKDALFPVLPLKPWQSALHLDSTLSRIEEAYGKRPFFVDIDEPEFTAPEKRRPVHDEIENLLVSINGYENWCNYVEKRSNLVPALQLSDLTQFSKQLDRLYSLGRGLLVPIKDFQFSNLTEIVKAVAARTLDGVDICFLLDIGQSDKSLLEKQAEFTSYIKTISAHANYSFSAISASSFPVSFVGRTSQDIYERQLFDGVLIHSGVNRLIYSDRGGAKAERQNGGGGTPAPRIDYAHPQRWTFFRDETPADMDLTPEARRILKIKAYIAQAKLLTADTSVWDPSLPLWGTQMIQRTALGDMDAINSPVRATAARINLHLHRQLFYDDPGAAYDTDEEWTD